MIVMETSTEPIPAHRLTKYGRPARATYRKINRGGVMMDEHRYVMERHLGRALRSDEVVHHVNGDKYDNRPDNLQVMSLAEHSRMHQSGENGTNAKLTEAQAREILLSTGNNRDIAARYGVCVWTVGAIKRGTIWKHLRPKV